MRPLKNGPEARRSPDSRACRLGIFGEKGGKGKAGMVTSDLGMHLGYNEALYSVAEHAMEGDPGLLEDSLG